MFFCSTRSFACRKWRLPCKRRCVISTLHRARILHANLFSRVAQPCELHLFVCHLETVILASACHVSHLMTTETHDAEWILSLVPTMNRHEVPSYYGSHANNTAKGSRSGSIIFGKNPTCQPATKRSELIAKQVLCRPDSHKKQAPNVKTLLLDIKMMVSPGQLTVPSAAPRQISLSVNPNFFEDRDIGNQFAPLWRELAAQLKIIFPDGDDEGAFIVQALDACHKSLASRIEETASGNLCSNLCPLEVDSCLPLLHLNCMFLVFVVKCCNGLSLKPARPMCDGRPFTSPLLRRLAGRGFFFRGFPFSMVFALCALFDSKRYYT